MKAVWLSMNADLQDIQQESTGVIVFCSIRYQTLISDIDTLTLALLIV